VVEFERRPESLAGGYFAEIAAFSLRAPPRGFEGELILRQLPGSPRNRLEIAVHEAVAELGFATPRVRASGGPEDGLGRAFVVMDRAPGRTFDQVKEPRERLRRVRAIPGLLAEAQARLHSLPAESLVERLAKSGIDASALSLDSLLAELGASVRALALPELADALAWLERTRPRPRRFALCHCDVHPNNLLVAADGSWTLIDWTNARIAEPELDIGFTAELLEVAPIPLPRRLRPLLAPLVRLWMQRGSRRFQAEYRARAEADPERVAWYQALYRLQLLVRVESAHAALPGAQPLSRAHPFRIAAPYAAARLRAALGSSRALRA
jgi:aminoglycoside phosphotransferase (APT) family kinase protein